LPRALLLDSLWPDWASVARQLECVAIVAQHPLYTPALAEHARNEGWRTLAYTVNDADDAARLRALGVDGLITDAVDAFDPTSE
jgi:glycerophosphoryl diester phosphodiesterase